MVVKSELKLIKSLQQKKKRHEHGLFVVEGLKTLVEVLKSGFKCYNIYTSKTEVDNVEGVKVLKISNKELQQISSLKNPNGYLGVFYIPEEKEVSQNDWILMLDGIQDPGNLGTIIRLCDWFGIATIICSLDTVDCYNPKVLQATMGSITRINVVYENLTSFLANSKLPVYGTFMEGDVITNYELPHKGILVMGNEGKGISEKIGGLCNRKISIPQFGAKTAESLNVAVATSILLHEIRK